MSTAIVQNCSWKRIRNRYKLWWNATPSVSVTGSDFEAAADDLAEEIGDKLGDFEIVLSFTPLAPQTGASDWFDPKLLALAFVKYADSDGKDPGLYEKGFCKTCGNAMGLRTALPVSINSKSNAEILAVSSSPTIVLISEEFLELLSSLKGKRLNVRPVECKKGAKYFELLGPADARWVSFVEAKHHPITCWLCPACGFQCLHPKHPKFYAFGFLSRSDFASDSRERFIVGDERGGYTLCVRADPWQKLLRRHNFRGVSSEPVAWVEDQILVRSPSLSPPPK